MQRVGRLSLSPIVPPRWSDRVTQPAMSPPSPDFKCLDCGYSLRDLPNQNCPECGRLFDLRPSMIL
jgi:hypothetical protein